MKNIILMILIMINLNATDVIKVLKYSATFDKNSNPHKDLSIAMQKAKISKKTILLIIGGDWCKWCGEFDNTLDNNNYKLAKELYSSFEVVRVYYGNGTNKQAQSLLKQFPKIPGTPHFYLLDSKAKLLGSVNSTSMERGYGYNARKVEAFIQQYKNKFKSTK
jgi:thioredoxin-related protein